MESRKKESVVLAFFFFLFSPFLWPSGHEDSEETDLPLLGKGVRATKKQVAFIYFHKITVNYH